MELHSHLSVGVTAIGVSFKVSFKLTGLQSVTLLKFHDERLSLSLFMPAGDGHFLPCDGYICRV